MRRSPRFYVLRDVSGRYWTVGGGWGEEPQMRTCGTVRQAEKLRDLVLELLGSRCPRFGILEFNLGGAAWASGSSGVGGRSRTAHSMPPKNAGPRIVPVLMPPDLLRRVEDHLSGSKMCRSDWIVGLVRRELESARAGRPEGPQPETIREGTSRPR